MKFLTRLYPYARQGRIVAGIAWALLFGLEVTWPALWPVAGQTAVLPAMLVRALPIALPALWLARPQRALLIAGMLALFYFSHGVVTVMSDPGTGVPATLEIIFSMSLILALAVAIPKVVKAPPREP